MAARGVPGASLAPRRPAAADSVCAGLFLAQPPGSNAGGVLVRLGNLRGFVPASQLAPHRKASDMALADALELVVDQTLKLRVMTCQYGPTRRSQVSGLALAPCRLARRLWPMSLRACCDSCGSCCCAARTPCRIAPKCRLD